VKLTKSQLKQVIKEELENVLNEAPPMNLNLRPGMHGAPDTDIVDIKVAPQPVAIVRHKSGEIFLATLADDGTDVMIWDNFENDVTDDFRPEEVERVKNAFHATSLTQRQRESDIEHGAWDDEE
tara:strand:- start:108 stop:479 length:372 start_codon:yes stop_codon:yes gene_type:complete